MKKLISIGFSVSLLSASIVANATAQPEVKDDCLLYGKNCQKRVDSLPEKITKLTIEIAKGENAYTQVELQKLERNLKEAKFDLRVLNKPGK